MRRWTIRCVIRLYGTWTRLKWYVWHGNAYKALQVVQSVEMDLDAAVAMSDHGTARNSSKAVGSSIPIRE